MGGTLEVKSKQHVGSSFSFTLPLRTVKDGTTQGSIPDSEPSRKPIVLTGGSDGPGKSTKGNKQMARDSKRSYLSIGEARPAGEQFNNFGLKFADLDGLRFLLVSTFR
jgi:hypothetical protein